jgi:hypothetical protein
MCIINSFYGTSSSSKIIFFHKEKKMAKQLRFFMILVGLVVGIGLMSCSSASFRAVDVTNTMAAYINNMDFYTPGPNEKIKTLIIDRTGSLQNDMSKYKGGEWYKTHQDKIVSIEAGVETSDNFKGYYGYTQETKDKWRIEYVE